MAQTEPAEDPGELPYRRHGIPALGFENYWYPLLLAREVGRRPKAARLLGRDIVLFRDAGKLFALEDRCPHRGVKLSLGACEYRNSGTISCPYHGWVFDGASGRLVAALMDGPDSPITRKVGVRSYPVREHAGMIWLWPGEMAPTALEDDVPEWVGDQNRFFSIPMYTDYRCNWRALVDNWGQDHHAQYVHRSSPELLFQPVLPFALTLEPTVLPGNKGIAFKRSGGMTSAEFPGLGRFPNNEWWRVMKPTGRGNVRGFQESKAHRVYGIRNQSEVWLPGLVVVGRLSGEYALIQWAVPIDAGTTRCFNINNFRRLGRWREMLDRVHYWLWRGWAHDRIFSDQDKVLVEALVPGPERLSRSDVGVIYWRKFAGANARRPDRPAEAARDVA
ncbi:aromatic ring-hydroxylating dioxygenase subunit alpha [Roseomonas sp. NAR14]|uniref:Aromatic ring-hydroxylating dioxygenase subunit alpha n=1 Tax=Roseomonas acroporae TaxID=2937791 RepID=A0A9X2BUQ9_9PROT|nr:aromatic ring-hydroxylating dioxygenase subunit alpha [Roseomonas acroporae]MCK8784406.1 aromatic ring-hydroxylating dioxygenase subunit alpha [Roseomonas acroporae]